MSVTAISGGTITTTSTSMTGIDSDAFLTLLCTELQYQDPLDPMESTEYMSQLAQLTMVEQLTNIASSVEDLNSALDTLSSANAVSQSLSAIGKKMDVGSDYISNGDEVVVSPAGDYDTVTLTLTSVEDGSTTEVTINSGESLSYTYDGSDNVTVTAAATKDGEAVDCTTTLYRLVKGVKSDSDGTIYLVATDGETYNLSDVTEIRL